MLFVICSQICAGPPFIAQIHAHHRSNPQATGQNQMSDPDRRTLPRSGVALRLTAVDNRFDAVSRYEANGDEVAIVGVDSVRTQPDPGVGEATNLGDVVRGEFPAVGAGEDLSDAGV